MLLPPPLMNEAVTPLSLAKAGVPFVAETGCGSLLLISALLVDWTVIDSLAPGVSSAVAPWTEACSRVSVPPRGTGAPAMVKVAVWLPMPPLAKTAAEGAATAIAGVEAKLKPVGSVTVKRELTSSDVATALPVVDTV